MAMLNNQMVFIVIFNLWPNQHGSRTNQKIVPHMLSVQRVQPNVRLSTTFLLGVKLFQLPNKQIPPIRRLVQPGKRRKKHFSGARLRVTNLGSVKTKCDTNQQNYSSYMGDATRGKCWMEISKMVGIRPTILDSTQQKLRIWCEYETTLVQANINGDNVAGIHDRTNFFVSVFSLDSSNVATPVAMDGFFERRRWTDQKGAPL